MNEDGESQGHRHACQSVRPRQNLRDRIFVSLDPKKSTAIRANIKAWPAGWADDVANDLDENEFCAPAATSFTHAAHQLLAS